MGEGKSADGNGIIGTILLVVAVVFLAWPYFLGTWLAVQFGADNPSTAREVTGWVLEAIWIAVLVSLMLGASFIDWRKRVQARRRTQLRAQRVEQFGFTGVELFEDAERSVSRIAASEAARTGWLGDPADVDFRADLEAIAENLRRAAEIRRIRADAATIRHFTDADKQMLADAKRAVARLEDSVKQRVALIAECAKQAGDIDKALGDDRERVVMSKRRAELRKRLGPILYGAEQIPTETSSESADVVTARAAAFHELRALIDRHRIEAEGG